MQKPATFHNSLIRLVAGTNKILCTWAVWGGSYQNEAIWSYQDVETKDFRTSRVMALKEESIPCPRSTEPVSGEKQGKMVYDLEEK